MSAPAPSETRAYRGYRYPAEIISNAVWLYFRFSLSLRDVEEVLAERGVTVSYETIRAWCAKFGPSYAAELRHRRARPSDKWHLDEVQLKINGKRHWLWRAVDKGLSQAWSSPISSRATRQQSDGCCQLLSIDGTRDLTTEPRTHTSRRVNVSERCAGSSRLSKRNAFSNRSVL